MDLWFLVFEQIYDDSKRIWDLCKHQTFADKIFVFFLQIKSCQLKKRANSRPEMKTTEASVKYRVEIL